MSRLLPCVLVTSSDIHSTPTAAVFPFKNAHSSHLVLLVSAQVGYAVLFKQLVVILLGEFFFPGTE